MFRIYNYLRQGPHKGDTLNFTISIIGLMLSTLNVSKVHSKDEFLETLSDIKLFVFLNTLSIANNYQNFDMRTTLFSLFRIIERSKSENLLSYFNTEEISFLDATSISNFFSSLLIPQEEAEKILRTLNLEKDKKLFKKWTIKKLILKEPKLIYADLSGNGPNGTGVDYIIDDDEEVRVNLDGISEDHMRMISQRLNNMQSFSDLITRPATPEDSEENYEDEEL